MKESAKENEDRAKAVLVSLKQKLIETKGENSKLNQDLKSLRQTSTDATATSTATVVSTNATVAKNIQNLKTGNLFTKLYCKKLVNYALTIPVPEIKW